MQYTLYLKPVNYTSYFYYALAYTDIIRAKTFILQPYEVLYRTAA